MNQTISLLLLSCLKLNFDSLKTLISRYMYEYIPMNYYNRNDLNKYKYNLEMNKITELNYLKSFYK
jgi:hypothetical protein